VSAALGVLIVGGGSAVGRATARALARSGAAVLLAGPPEAALREGAPVPAGADGRHALALLDEITEASLDALFEHALRSLPRFDALVLCQGVGPTSPLSLSETSVSEWEAGFARPLRQAFLTVQRAVDEWLVGGVGGRAVLVADAVDAAWHAPRAAYHGALAAFGRSVAKEYGRRAVRCNMVAVPAGGEGVVEVAELVTFLLSDAASFVTGESLVARGPAGIGVR
jgi:3-oxoacyl-[acyl-carrier protein] reductase